MKRIGLIENELIALESALIDHSAVITFDQLSSYFDENLQYTRKRVQRLVKQGWLKPIKKGVYVISDLSSRGRLSISHSAIVNAIVEEAYISFENALHYHGLYDQLLSSINSISLKQYKSTTIDNISYNFIKTQQHYFYGWEIHDIDGQLVKIASIEKALIDLIQFHRTRYSTDLVLEKLRNFSNDIEVKQLVEYILKANLTTQRIMGFLMDCINLDTHELFNAVKDRQSVSSISNSENNLYNHKWKLYYDPHFEECAHG